MINNIRNVGIGLLLLFLIVFIFTFQVRENQIAIKTRFGSIVTWTEDGQDVSSYKPGLHFKLPFIEKVNRFDRRIVTMESAAERILTSEKKNVLVDSFVKWRVVDGGVFFRSSGGDLNRANSLLKQTVRKSVLDAFGRRSVQDVISGDRDVMMTEVESAVENRAESLGVEIVDVRVKKVEWPDSVLSSVYARMDKERATVAKFFRSTGEEEAKGIRADADRQRTEILARAYAESEKLRGAGDALAADIYATAFGENPEFYRMWRTLNAYQSTFTDRSDVLLLDPNDEFFRYFKSPTSAKLP